MTEAFASNWVNRKGYAMRLELPAAQFYRGDPLVGVARLRSTSPKEVAVRRTSVSLWATDSNNATEILFEEPLFERITLAPSLELEHPFRIPIPEKAALGASRVMLTTGGGIFQYVLPPFVTVRVAPERWMASVVEVVAEIA